MQIIIENGTTLIKTGDANGGVKNKYNQTGVSTQIDNNGNVRYRAEIQIKGKKHYLGIRDTIEEAGALRQEAEKQIKKGTFDGWVKHIKNPLTKSKYEKIGVSKCKMSNGTIKYMVQFKHGGVRYYLGKMATLQEAYALLDDAEKQVGKGTFEEWYKELKTKHKPRGKNK